MKIDLPERSQLGQTSETIGMSLMRQMETKLERKSLLDWLLPWRAKKRLAEYRSALALAGHLREVLTTDRTALREANARLALELKTSQSETVAKLTEPAQHVMQTLLGLDVDPDRSMDQIRLNLRVDSSLIESLPTDDMQREVFVGIFEKHLRTTLVELWRRLKAQRAKAQDRKSESEEGGSHA